MKTTNEIAQEAAAQIYGLPTVRASVWHTQVAEIITKAIEAATVEGEPVAIAECKTVHGYMCQFLNRTPYGQETLKDGDKLYTAPPKRQPLTIEAIWEVVCATAKDGEVDAPSFEEFISEPDVENVIAFFRRIEAAINGEQI